MMLRGVKHGVILAPIPVETMEQWERIIRTVYWVERFDAKKGDPLVLTHAVWEVAGLLKKAKAEVVAAVGRSTDHVEENAAMYEMLHKHGQTVIREVTIEFGDDVMRACQASMRQL